MSGVPGTVERPRQWPGPPPGIPREFAPTGFAKALARIPMPGLVLRAVPFFVLGLLAAAHWAALVTPAPTGRALLAVVIATIGGVLIALSAPLPRAAGTAIRIFLVLVTLVLSITAIGVPFKLLMPRGLDTLSDRVTGGLSVVGAVTEWPYGGPNVWLRLTALMAVPLILSASAALAFWPGRDGAGDARRASRFTALILLVALYAVAVAARPFGQQGLRGLALLACLAAWLWVPRLRSRDAAAATIAIVIAALAGLGLTAKVASSEPWVDYRHWSWTLHRERTIAFDWSHNYGPLQWPRKGTTLLLIKAKQAHYWKAETLDRFDGIRWSGVPARNPDPTLAQVAVGAHPKWLENVRVTVRGLRSDRVIGPGALLNVKGTPGDAVGLSNATYLLTGELGAGDSYTVRSYTPDPTAKQMRAASAPDALFEAYTKVNVPQPGGFISSQLNVPVRGVAGSGDPESAGEVERSSYGRIYDLAQRITSGAATNYDVVKKVGAYLEANYAYTENVPRRPYPLESFLFQDKKGYCQHFSGAAALMLRMLGVPVRIASGFAPGTLNSKTKEYVVRDLDAHSWIEVWFSGIGWVPFDPTPALAPAASQARSFAPRSENASAARGDTADRLSKKLSEDILAQGAGAGGATAEPEKKTPWLAIILGSSGVALVLIAAAALIARARSRRGPPPSPCGDAEVDHLVLLLSRLGLEVKPGTTLYTLEARLQALGGPSAAGYARRLRRRRFGGNGEPPPSRGERRQLRRALASAVGAGPLTKLHLALPEILPSLAGGRKLPGLHRSH